MRRRLCISAVLLGVLWLLAFALPLAGQPHPGGSALAAGRNPSEAQVQAVSLRNVEAMSRQPAEAASPRDVEAVSLRHAASPDHTSLPKEDTHAESSGQAEGSSRRPQPRVEVDSSFGQLPLYFVENRGQVDPQIAYYIQGRDKTVYFTPQGVTFVLSGPEAALDQAQAQPHPRDAESRHPLGGAESRPPDDDMPLQRWAVKLDFVEADPGVQPVAQDLTPAVISYFKGPPEQWKAGLKTYAGVVYRDLWPGIDLVYSGTVNRLKYQFVVQPGADPAQIQLAYRGATAVSINETGQLEVSTPLGGFHDDTPYAYQEAEGGRRVEVEVAYALQSDGDADRYVYGFRIGAYDRAKPLVLDPSVLLYCGYIGGSQDDEARGVAADDSGNAYIVGFTRSDESSFPVTVGPILTYTFDYDVFVAKVKSHPSDSVVTNNLYYCGYIGGSWNDFGYDIAVDSAGNAYITGAADSDETLGFPVIGGPDLTAAGGGEAFVAKVNPSGTALVYCGFIGGSEFDEGGGITVDGSGNAYVTGATLSSDFPVVSGPDPTYNVGYDAFVAKVKANPTDTVVITNNFHYAGYIGGIGTESGLDIAIDGGGNAYVCGHTTSSEDSFPVAVGPDLTYNGGSEQRGDAFVAKVNSAGAALVYCGYIGGSNDDSAEGIAVDNAGNAYVVGWTESTQATFPATVGPVLTHGGNRDAFVAKVKANPNSLVVNNNFHYCGYVGGTQDEEARDAALDAAGHVYLTGYTYSSESQSFPVFVGPDLTHNGGRDCFATKVDPYGTGFVFSGYFGGSGFDEGWDIAADYAETTYHVGATESNELSFPATVGPDVTYNGGRDGFVAKVSAYLDCSITSSAPPQGVCTSSTGHTASAPTSSPGSIYGWYATGATIVSSSPYTETIDWDPDGVGTAIIGITITDTQGYTCTSSVAVTVYDTPDCTISVSALDVAAGSTGHSAWVQSAGSAATYDWSILNGSITAGQNTSSIVWDAGAEGTITITAAITDSWGCACTGYVTVTAHGPPTADFDGAPRSCCAPLTVYFTDTSIPAVTINEWYWDFGDGGVSASQNPAQTYTTAGVYTVTLTVTNTADYADTVTKTNYITAGGLPYAEFSADPTEGCAPLDVDFTNESGGNNKSITAWYWDFGDGGTSTSPSPSHQYTASGVYTVTLTITNECGSDVETKTSYVTVTEGPTASFTEDKTDCCADLTVCFTDTSTAGDNDIDEWYWDFGDGGTSSEPNPCHLYSAGTYTVTLTVTDTYGCTDTVTKTNHITANEGPTASFIEDQTDCCADLTVCFTDTSTAGDNEISAWYWEFGDGVTSAISQTCHTYSAGVYTVTLTVTDTHGCTDTVTKTNHITANVGPTANFTATPTSGYAPLTVYFTDTSTAGDNDIDDWYWDFGDNVTSTLQSPSHVYDIMGVYTVTLTVTDTHACSDTVTKTSYIIVDPEPGTPTPTPTDTLTPTPTDTPTPTPTDTVTPTPTDTLTPTPTDTLTPTPMDTLTPTPTDTSTPTPTGTVTSTPTDTLTPTPTDTVTATPTDTLTPTPTPTPTETLTPTPTATPTPTGTPHEDLTVTGLVYNAAIGPTQPIPGAVVSVVVCTPHAFQAVTGADGRYSILVPGEYLHPCTEVTLYAWATGYYSFSQVIAVVDLRAQPVRDIGLEPTGLPTPTRSPTPTDTLTPTRTDTRTPTPTKTRTPLTTPTPTETLPADLTITGLVYNAAIGPAQPIPGAAVSVVMCTPRTFQAVTGPDGRYSILVPGEYLHPCTEVTLYAWATGYYSFSEVIAVVDLRAQPVRDIGLEPTGLPTPTRSPTGTRTQIPTPTHTLPSGGYGGLLPLVLRRFPPPAPPTPTLVPTATPTLTSALTPTPTPTATSTPVLAPTATPTSPSQEAQLIINPSFETDEAWEIPKTVYPATYSISRAHSGYRSMQLGQAPGGNLYSYSSVQQTVEIPSGATQANLSFYYFPLMAPTEGDHIYFCVLRASDDGILQCIFWTDHNQSWNLGTFDLLSYAGQRIKVHFGVRNDGLDGITAVYLDDVELWVRW